MNALWRRCFRIKWSQSNVAFAMRRPTFHAFLRRKTDEVPNNFNLNSRQALASNLHFWQYKLSKRMACCLGDSSNSWILGDLPANN